MEYPGGKPVNSRQARAYDGPLKDFKGIFALLSEVCGKSVYRAVKINILPVWKRPEIVPVKTEKVGPAGEYRRTAKR